MYVCMYVCTNNPKKNLLNSNTFSTCPHSMVNFGPLTAVIVSLVTALTSITEGQPNFAQCLAVSYAGTLYIHFRWLLLPKEILPGAKFTLSCILLYWQHYCTALEQWASNKLCSMVQGIELLNFRRGRHLYSAGRPSRWALAHILVHLCIQ